MNSVFVVVAALAVCCLLVVFVVGAVGNYCRWSGWRCTWLLLFSPLFDVGVSVATAVRADASVP